MSERKIAELLRSLRYPFVCTLDLVYKIYIRLVQICTFTYCINKTMSTYYYIVAFLMFPWMSDPYIMVNTEMRYKNFGDCYTTMMKNRSVLTMGLHTRYPDLKDYSIRCIDHKNLYDLQQNLNQKRHEPT